MKAKRFNTITGRTKETEGKIIQKEKELNKLKNDVNEFRRGNIVIKRGQTLFIAEVNSSSNIKLDLAKFIMKLINLFGKLLCVKMM